MITLFKSAGPVLRRNRGWMYIAGMIFLASGILVYSTAGPANEPLNEIVNGQYEQLQNLFAFILESGPLLGAVLVFLNNFISMAQMLLLGALLAISPLLTLGINGALVGALAAHASGQGIPLLPLLVFGILPHGVFELFAFFLCGGLGIKFGYHVIFPLQGKNRLESFKYIWKEALAALPLVVALLLAAALVEMLITPVLLGLVMDVPF